KGPLDGRSVIGSGRTVSQMVNRRVVLIKQSRRAVDFSHPDALPETAPYQPRFAVFIQNQIWINRVPLVPWLGAQHLPLIHPFIFGASGVEGNVCRQSDGRILAAKA